MTVCFFLKKLFCFLVVGLEKRYDEKLFNSRVCKGFREKINTGFFTFHRRKIYIHRITRKIKQQS